MGVGETGVGEMGVGETGPNLYISFHSPFPTMLHIKFDWQSGFREEDL